MNLNKPIWTQKDIIEFNNYLLSFGNEDMIKFSSNIIKTNKEIIGLKSPQLKDIAKEIHNGNYLSYMDNYNLIYHENTIIFCYLLGYIKDMELYKKYLDTYVLYIDNWASCDSVVVKVNKKNKDFLYNLAIEYINSDILYKKRTGYDILFKYVDDNNYIDGIINIINKENMLSEYYISMVVAWLLCDIMIKQKSKCYEYLNNHNLDRNTLKRFIQKCRDSYRVDINDKNKLKEYL